MQRFPEAGSQVDNSFPEEPNTHRLQQYTIHPAQNADTNSPLSPESHERSLNENHITTTRRKFKELPSCDPPDDLWDPPRDGIDKPVWDIANFLNAASDYPNSSSLSSLSVDFSTLTDCLFQDAFTWTSPVRIEGGKDMCVIIEGPTPVLEGDVRDRLQQLVELMNGPLELSIKLNYNHVIPAAAQDIMREIIRLVKDYVGSLKLTAPSQASTNPAGPGTSYVVESAGRALFEIPLLRDFSWTGDLKLLPSPWYSLSNLPFDQLKTLTLNCDLSIDDCMEILYRGSKLVNFEVNSVASPESILRHTFQKQDGIIEVQNMKVLTISSPDDCNVLFEKFKFSKLANITLISNGNSALDSVPPD